MNCFKVTLAVAMISCLFACSTATSGHALAQSDSTVPAVDNSSQFGAPLLVIPAERPQTVWPPERAQRRTKYVNSGFQVLQEGNAIDESELKLDESEQDELEQDDVEERDLDQELRDLERDLEESGANDDDRKPQSQPFGMWPRKSIREISINIVERNSEAPEDQSGQLTNSMTQQWAPTNKLFAWSAPEIRYQPLFFEDIALERYGQTQGAYRQSLTSAARFAKSALALPYAMTIDSPNRCEHPLGFCRPGSRTGCLKQAHFFSR